MGALKVTRRRDGVMAAMAGGRCGIRAVAILLALTLGACSGLGRRGFGDERRRAEEIANAFPENYKSDILALLRTYLNDPTGIRGAFVSEPVLKPVGRETRYVACVRFNARKTSGDYAGAKDSLAIFLAGRLDQITEAGREQCAGAAYQPFPELERLTR